MVYGENTLNAHAVLKYGMTHEFFVAYRWLKYGRLELPPVMMRSFHVRTRPLVERKRLDRRWVTRYRRRFRLKDMARVQSLLRRLPKRARATLPAPERRNMLLVPGQFADLAFDQFRDRQVMFILSTPRDREALAIRNLPENFCVFDFQRALAREKLPVRTLQLYKKRIAKLSARHRRHPVFGKKSFQKWLIKQCGIAIKTIRVLDRLIRNHPVGVIADHVESVNPGMTLAILAHAYRLPFVQIPQSLVTDRSVIPSRASHFCLWGTDYRNWYADRGIPPSRIRLTGNFRFAYTSYVPRFGKKALLKRMGTSTGQCIALFTVQPFEPAVQKKMDTWLHGIARHLPDLTVWIKPHPFSRPAYVWKSRHPRVRIVGSDLGLGDVLPHADILLTVSSNTAVEAALIGKPIFILQPSIPYSYNHHHNHFNAFLVRAKAGYAAHTPFQLALGLRRFIRDSVFRKELQRQSRLFLQRTLAHDQNTAHIRTAAVLKELLARREVMR